MPVVRNPQYYFKEGFCWTNVLTTYIKCRKKQKTVHSTESMSFFSAVDNIPESYMISLMNSRLIAFYIDSFVNSTSHCTTGDAKLIPLLIPTQNQLDKIKKIFDEAMSIKRKEVDNLISENEAETLLDIVQKELDNIVEYLYGI
mgnify:FL=1